MSVVTKGGDLGYTSLYNGEKVSKDHPRIKALGEIQHLSYMISRFLVHLEELIKVRNLDDLIHDLQVIMHWLYELSAYIATPRNRSSVVQLKNTQFHPSKEKALHKIISHFETILPKQTCLLLPLGNKYSCGAYLLSSQTRKVERKIYTTIKESEVELKTVLPFINRLSDYFYIVARVINNLFKIKEVPYKKNMKMYIHLDSKKESE